MLLLYPIVHKIRLTVASEPKGSGNQRQRRSTNDSGNRSRREKDSEEIDSQESIKRHDLIKVKIESERERIDIPVVRRRNSRWRRRETVPPFD